MLSSTPPIISGRGMRLPDEALSNADVAALADPRQLRLWAERNQWCRRQLDSEAPGAWSEGEIRGIFERYVAERIGINARRVIDRQALIDGRPSRRGVHASDLGAGACRAALDAAAVDPEEVDALICGTSSPERIYPTTAIEIQSKIGARRAHAFDLLAACSSFVYGLHMARGLIEAGIHRRILVVAAEYFTSAVDYADPNNSFFWGDGAAAALVESQESARRPEGYLLVDTHCLSIPSQNIRTGLGGTKPFLARMACAAPEPPRQEPGESGATDEAAYPYFWQDGPQVFKDVVPVVVRETRSIVERNGLALDDVRQFMFHQPSALFLGSLAKRLLGVRLPCERVPTSFLEYGNTSSAGAPICLAEEATMAAGEHACMTVFGAGYTVACALLRKS